MCGTISCINAALLVTIRTAKGHEYQRERGDGIAQETKGIEGKR